MKDICYTSQRSLIILTKGSHYFTQPKTRGGRDGPRNHSVASRILERL